MNLLIILSAKYLVFIIPLVAIIYLLLEERKRQKTIAIFSLASLALAFILGKIGGALYYDPRPFVTHHFTPLISHAPTNGFPSDHALFGFAIAAIIFVFRRNVGIALGVVALIVGAARVLAGVHSPIDILGSFVISVVAVSIIWWIHKKYIRF